MLLRDVVYPAAVKLYKDLVDARPARKLSVFQGRAEAKAARPSARR